MRSNHHRIHTIENASFSARRTELAWTFFRPYDEVWDAVLGAASMAGLGVVSADRRVGLAVARLPFSLLNVGRRAAFTFSRTDEDKTLVRATLLHGVMSLQSRRSRQLSLETVLRAAREILCMAMEDEQAQPDAGESGIRARGAPVKAPRAHDGDQEATPREERASTMRAQRPAQESGVGASPGAKPREASHLENLEHQPRPEAQTTARPHPTAERAERENSPASTPRLDSMDFGNADWENLPLTPPTGHEASRYRHRASGGAEPGFGRAVLWFVLGLALAFGAALAVGGLSILLH